jgi:APA family basic amino acid/polyamine antiporter
VPADVTPASPEPAVRPSLGVQLRRRKPLESFVDEQESSGQPALRRTLGVWHLTAISIGATLGTGILVVLGTAVPLAGPAVWLAFVLAGVAALLSALSYAEMAGSVPVSGSSYSYAYATLGEGLAWVCGWCLVLEYAVSVAAVAVGAGQYVNEALGVVGLALPAAIADPPGAGGVVNLPAAALVLLATAVLLPGAREGAWVNTVLVVVKVGLLVFFVAVAFSAFRAGNFEPLAPMGAAGVSAAASRLFFSYIGFDAASTAGEEARDARRDLPRAIIASIVIITVLYVLVAVAAIGARPWTDFTDGEATLVTIVADITGQPWVAFLFAVTAVAAIASVVLTVLYGQTRIFVSMARDGLVPRVLGRVSARTRTPVTGTLIVGGAVALTAAFVPLGALADATSIGTLFAFALVNVSVVWLRRNRPELDRTFRVPGYPVVPVLGFAACVLLMVTLGWITWVAFALWMVVGTAVYLGYGRRHSVVGRAS